MRSQEPRCVCVCVSSLEFTVTIQQRNTVTFYMPLWMPSGTLLNVTAECSMPSFPEGFTDRLRFFTCYQYIHNSFFILFFVSLGLVI